MLRIARVLIPGAVLAALIWVPVIRAQQPADPTPAPIPSQILAAKKVFISNASGLTSSAIADPDLPYNEFYAAMKSWGRYELVGAPGDADLVFELRYVIVLWTTSVTGGQGGTITDPEFTLAILDPKTKVVLWAFTESVHKAGKQTGRQAFDDALLKIVDDVKKVSVQSSAAK